MADDHAPSAPRPDFDLDTDEGLSAYLEDLHARRGVPESLRYPETDEEWDRMIDEVEADVAARGTIPAEKVEAWLRSLGTANPFPRPEPECE